jgi:hypothetical protein
MLFEVHLRPIWRLIEDRFIVWNGVLFYEYIADGCGVRMTLGFALLTIK